MNKYELAVVLSAKLEDEERAAALEKVQGYITRFGGTVTGVDDWGKKRLAYEIQKAKRLSTTSSSSSLRTLTALTKWKHTSASWSRLSDIFA